MSVNINFIFTIGVICTTLLMCFSSGVRAGEKILIAAASDLNFAMDEICHAFEKVYPAIDVEVSYGSSGNFFAQITHGAPFDIFFSADASYPARLEKEGFTVKGQRQLYAFGKIVLWVPRRSGLNPQKGLNIILGTEVEKLAIANPRHAPYGRAAEEVLRHYGLWDKIQNKLVFGENVSQAAQFVQSGVADAGIIALSLAVSPGMVNDGSYWIIPDESYSRLDQVCAVLQKSKDKPAVTAFFKFIQGGQAGKIFSDYGFTLP